MLEMSPWNKGLGSQAKRKSDDSTVIQAMTCSTVIQAMTYSTVIQAMTYSTVIQAMTYSAVIQAMTYSTVIQAQQNGRCIRYSLMQSTTSLSVQTKESDKIQSVDSKPNSKSME